MSRSGKFLEIGLMFVSATYHDPVHLPKIILMMTGMVCSHTIIENGYHGKNTQLDNLYVLGLRYFRGKSGQGRRNSQEPSSLTSELIQIHKKETLYK